MRNNQPVSQQEFSFPKGKTLVSTTDLKGRIKHCNAAFIEVSGYAGNELLGQPHNLIRHPDMPEEAFRDMWDTIKSGQPWSGVVKNRRKNGDHYWVLANVTPLMENHQPVAYMSVRTEPARAQIEAAERLYATMRAEKQAGRLIHVLRQGQLQRQDWLGRLAQQQRHLPWLRRWSGYALMLGAGLLAKVLELPMALELAALLSLSILLATVAHRHVQKSQQAPLAYANQLAAGDLSQALASSGAPENRALEIALNQLAVNIRALVSDTRSELEAMSASTRLIATGNKDLAQRTESQAASLEQTAAAMEEITGTVRSSTDTADQASNVVKRLSDMSQRSAEVVHHASHSMAAIANSSKRIGEIIAVIDSIAFQTNILALNAAVESARAGEHGRGFAVVASEVRALAQRSSAAAREIAQLIHDSADKVSEGERHTSTARESIDATMQSMQDFGALMGQVHLSAQEHLTGITQVNQAINHMEQITIQNADMVQDLSGSAQQLMAQVEEVTAALRVFTLTRR